MRAPFQVLIFPYLIINNQISYCIFKRSDLQIWQGIAGGGENTENALEAAKRESFEEAGISADHNFLKLESIGYIPTKEISSLVCNPKLLNVPEYSFGVQLQTKLIKIQKEHSKYLWLPFLKALNKLNFESNKLAINELNKKLLESF